MTALTSSNHYVRFNVIPPCADAITLRKTIQDSLGQTFGVVASNTYVDILWFSEDGDQAVVGIAQSEVARLLVSTAAFAGSPRLSVVKESSFLPSLLSAGCLGKN